MVALDQILTMPLEDLSGDALREFLRLRIPEGRHIEYKTKLVADVLCDIAAMANTYGGLILIGVSEERRLPIRVEGAEDTTYEDLVNRCIDKFEPPFVPEVSTADVDGKSMRRLWQTPSGMSGLGPRPDDQERSNLFLRSTEKTPSDSWREWRSSLTSCRWRSRHTLEKQ